MPDALEKTVMVEVYVESCSSTTKNIISPLHKTYGLRTWQSGDLLWEFPTDDLFRSRDKLKPFYLRPHDTWVHQTWQGGDLQWGTHLESLMTLWISSLERSCNKLKPLSPPLQNPILELARPLYFAEEIFRWWCKLDFGPYQGSREL